jgi:hypothetical protein
VLRTCCQSRHPCSPRRCNPAVGLQKCVQLIVPHNDVAGRCRAGTSAVPFCVVDVQARQPAVPAGSTARQRAAMVKIRGAAGVPLLASLVRHRHTTCPRGSAVQPSRHQLPLSRHQLPNLLRFLSDAQNVTCIDISFTATTDNSGKALDRALVHKSLLCTGAQIEHTSATPAHIAATHFLAFS